MMTAAGACVAAFTGAAWDLDRQRRRALQRYRAIAARLRPAS